MSDTKKRVQSVDAPPSGSRVGITQSQMTPVKTSAISCKDCNIFIVSPSELSSLGLITKIENGKPIIMPTPDGDNSIQDHSNKSVHNSVVIKNVPNSFGTSTAISKNVISNSTENKAAALNVISRLHNPIQSLNNADKCALRQFRRKKFLIQDREATTSSSKNAEGSSETGSSNVGHVRRTSNRRIIPMFAKHWVDSLREIGYIRCPLRACNYIGLNFVNMVKHYTFCNGEPCASGHICPTCKGCLECASDLEKHILVSHSKTNKNVEQKIEMEKVKTGKQNSDNVFVRKRAYSKVHKLSWNIALEEKGYVICFFKNCNFLALSLQEMIQHYRICNGSGSSASIACPYCNGRVETHEKLEAHIRKSHLSDDPEVHVDKSGKAWFPENDLDNRVVDKPPQKDLVPFYPQIKHELDSQVFTKIPVTKNLVPFLNESRCDMIEIDHSHLTSDARILIENCQKTSQRNCALSQEVETNQRSMLKHVHSQLLNTSQLKGNEILCEVNPCTVSSVEESKFDASKKILSQGEVHLADKCEGLEGPLVLYQDTFSLCENSYNKIQETSQLLVSQESAACDLGVKPINCNNQSSQNTKEKCSDSQLHCLYSAYETNDGMEQVESSFPPESGQSGYVDNLLQSDFSRNEECSLNMAGLIKTYSRSCTLSTLPCKKTYSRKHLKSSVNSKNNRMCLTNVTPSLSKSVVASLPSVSPLNSTMKNDNVTTQDGSPVMVQVKAKDSIVFQKLQEFVSRCDQSKLYTGLNMKGEILNSSKDVLPNNTRITESSLIPQAFADAVKVSASDTSISSLVLGCETQGTSMNNANSIMSYDDSKMEKTQCQSLCNETEITIVVDETEHSETNVESVLSDTTSLSHCFIVDRLSDSKNSSFHIFEMQALKCKSVENEGTSKNTTQVGESPENHLPTELLPSNEIVIDQKYQTSVTNRGQSHSLLIEPEQFKAKCEDADASHIISQPHVPPRYANLNEVEVLNKFNNLDAVPQEGMTTSVLQSSANEVTVASHFVPELIAEESTEILQSSNAKDRNTNEVLLKASADETLSSVLNEKIPEKVPLKTSSGAITVHSEVHDTSESVSGVSIENETATCTSIDILGSTSQHIPLPPRVNNGSSIPGMISLHDKCKELTNDQETHVKEVEYLGGLCKCSDVHKISEQNIIALQERPDSSNSEMKTSLDTNVSSVDTIARCTSHEFCDIQESDSSVRPAASVQPVYETQCNKSEVHLKVKHDECIKASNAPQLITESDLVLLSSSTLNPDYKHMQKINTNEQVQNTGTHPNLVNATLSVNIMDQLQKACVSGQNEIMVSEMQKDGLLVEGSSISEITGANQLSTTVTYVDESVTSEFQTVCESPSLDNNEKCALKMPPPQNLNEYVSKKSENASGLCHLLDTDGSSVEPQAQMTEDPPSNLSLDFGTMKAVEEMPSKRKEDVNTSCSVSLTDPDLQVNISEEVPCSDSSLDVCVKESEKTEEMLCSRTMDVDLGCNKHGSSSDIYLHVNSPKDMNALPFVHVDAMEIMKTNKTSTEKENVNVSNDLVQTSIPQSQIESTRDVTCNITNIINETEKMEESSYKVKQGISINNDLQACCTDSQIQENSPDEVEKAPLPGHVTEDKIETNQEKHDHIPLQVNNADEIKTMVSEIEPCTVLSEQKPVLNVSQNFPTKISVEQSNASPTNFVDEINNGNTGEGHGTSMLEMHSSPVCGLSEPLDKELKKRSETIPSHCIPEKQNDMSICASVSENLIPRKGVDECCNKVLLVSEVVSDGSEKSVSLGKQMESCSENNMPTVKPQELNIVSSDPNLTAFSKSVQPARQLDTDSENQATGENQNPDSNVAEQQNASGAARIVEDNYCINNSDNQSAKHISVTMSSLAGESECGENEKMKTIVNRDSKQVSAFTVQKKRRYKSVNSNEADESSVHESGIANIRRGKRKRTRKVYEDDVILYDLYSCKLPRKRKHAETTLVHDAEDQNVSSISRSKRRNRANSENEMSEIKELKLSAEVKIDSGSTERLSEEVVSEEIVGCEVLQGPDLNAQSVGESSYLGKEKSPSDTQDREGKGEREQETRFAGDNHFENNEKEVPCRIEINVNTGVRNASEESVKTHATPTRKGRQRGVKQEKSNFEMTNQDVPIIKETILQQAKTNGRKHAKPESGGNQEENGIDDVLSDAISLDEETNSSDLLTSNVLQKETSSSAKETSITGGSESLVLEECLPSDVSKVGTNNVAENSKKGWLKGKTKKRRRKVSDTARKKKLRQRLQNKQEQDIEDRMIQCGKCKEEMMLSVYDTHSVMKHNGLSWIEGDPPLDMNDEKKILSILWRAVNCGKKKSLTCEICGKKNKSAVGFKSHMNFCQKTVEEREAMKERCEICGRLMIPASLKVHMGVHKKETKQRILDAEEQNDNKTKKRAAAEKAASLMLEFIKDEQDDLPVLRKRQGATPDSADSIEGFYKTVGITKVSNAILNIWKKLLTKNGVAGCRMAGCSFEGSSIEQLEKHYLQCSKSTKKGYYCQLCSFYSQNEVNIKSHVLSAHFNGQDDGSDSESDEIEMRRSEGRTYSKPSNRVVFLAKEMSGSVQGDRPYLPATRWTLKYHLKNYSEALFPGFHTTVEDWIPVSELECKDYIPMTEESIPVSAVCMKGTAINPHTVDLVWKRFKTFESEIIDGVPIFFAGGPVWALSWCTIPLQATIKTSSYVNQFLAVSCHRKMDDLFYTNDKYEGKGLIQLWDFGHLDNLKDYRKLIPPKFVMGIAHEYGVIWCLEWCPSGCYECEDNSENRLRRMGLLAAAFSDGVVRIFSICFPSEAPLCEGRFPIYKCEPSATLVLDPVHTTRLGGFFWNCVRLSWYKGKDHRIIAGSFTNGMVALWDIGSTSSLLSKKEGKSHVYYPYHTFQAHYSNITALDLSPHDNARYLITGSVDCTIKIWDLEDTSSPITMYRKSMVTDGLWLPHWPSSVISFDDVFIMGHCNSTLNPPRGFGFKLYPILAQNSAAWSVSSSDWVNAVAQSTQAGELTAIFPHQLLIGVDTEKGMKDKRMVLSYVELKDFSENAGEHVCTALCLLPCQKKASQSNNEQMKATEKNKRKGKPVNKKSEAVAENTREEINEEEGNNAGEVDNRRNKTVVENMNIDDGSNSSVHKQPSAEGKSQHMVESVADEKGVSFFIERHPRIGKKCVISQIQRAPRDHEKKQSEVLPLLPFGNTNEPQENESEEEKCYSMLCEPEKKLLLCVKRDMEKLNLTSKLRIIFPNKSGDGEDVNVNEEDEGNKRCLDRPDNIKVYQMIVTTVKEKLKHLQKAPTNKETKMNETRNPPSNDKNDETFHPGMYDDVAKKYGMILCDFYTEDMKEMPYESRLWMKKSDQMKAAPIHMYPLMSINKVHWNPNCRSFLWLAAGYQCGLVRVPCISGMHTHDVDKILEQAADEFE